MGPQQRPGTQEALSKHSWGLTPACHAGQGPAGTKLGASTYPRRSGSCLGELPCPWSAAGSANRGTVSSPCTLPLCRAVASVALHGNHDGFPRGQSQQDPQAWPCATPWARWALTLSLCQVPLQGSGCGLVRRPWWSPAQQRRWLPGLGDTAGHTAARAGWPLTCRYSVKKGPSSVFSSCLWAGDRSGRT